MQYFPVRILRIKQNYGQISISFSWPSCCSQSKMSTHNELVYRRSCARWRRFLGSTEGEGESCTVVPAELAFSICAGRNTMETGWLLNLKANGSDESGKGPQGIKGTHTRYLYGGLLSFYNNGPTVCMLATTVIGCHYSRHCSCHQHHRQCFRDHHHNQNE